MLTTASNTMTAMLTVSVIRRSTSIEINKKPVDVSFLAGSLSFYDGSPV
jgi:hypothetical protein